MTKERFAVHVTVHLLLINNNKVLAMKRCNTGYMDGYYGFVSGHLENNESLRHAMAREAFEEVGIVIKEEDLDITCMIRRGDNNNYFNIFLKAEKYEGEPKNMEPDKCEKLAWLDINDLPENTIAAEKRAIYNYINEIRFDEYNF